VDAFDRKGLLVTTGAKWKRNPYAVPKTVRIGYIQAHYESYWHSWDQRQEWMNASWPVGGAYHLDGRQTNVLRAEPVQLAILNSGNHLEGFCRHLLK
jgi:hypothetical protein